jgi:hypothetical protein
MVTLLFGYKYVFLNESVSSAVSAYEGVSKSVRTGHLEPELQMIQLSATRCIYIAIL